MNTRLKIALLSASLVVAALPSFDAALAGDWNEAVSARAALLNDPQVPAGSVMAGQWTTPVSGKTSVTGDPQTADRSSDWVKAVAAKEDTRGPAQAGGHEPYGFLAQARPAGTTSSKEVAGR
jgi:hypothetical protein